MASACRCFCFETTSSGSMRLSAASADSIDLCRMVSTEDTLRALAFCTPHLASAPNPIRHALGEGIYDWLAWFSGAKMRTARFSSINSLSRAFAQNLWFPWVQMIRKVVHGRISVLFANDDNIPMLDVAITGRVGAEKAPSTKQYSKTSQPGTPTTHFGIPASCGRKVRIVLTEPCAPHFVGMRGPAARLVMT
jgi:hypothetical protein